MSDLVTPQTASYAEKAENKQTLIDNEDENLTIHGYKSNLAKSVVTHIFYVLTLGLLRLLFHWFPTWRLHATHSRCSLSTAEKILLVDKYRGKHETYYVEEVRTLQATPESNATSVPYKLTAYLDNKILIESPQLRVVSCKKLLYIWYEKSRQFIKLCGIDQGRKCLEFHKLKGYTQAQQLIQQVPYGKNEIQIPFYTIPTLLVLEALTPFYIFQVFSLIVWFSEGYYYYTIAIVAMSVFGIMSSVIQTRRNQHTLREFQTSEKVTISRGSGATEEISSIDLVPGDVIEIPKSGCVLQCDAVLLNGNCIVNESMLTGESVPVTKTPIPKTSCIYDAKEDTFHTLFCGTKIIQTNSPDSEKVFAVVLRTGYLTKRGELVRSILFPPPSDFKFDRDSYKFIGILAVIALLGCVYTAVSKSNRSITASDIVIKALDLITIVIPPALPAAMTVGKLYALGRLKMHNIFCMNSRVINVSGSIDCVCFDKTGTLTEDGLEMWGVVPVTENNLGTPIKKICDLPSNSDLVKGMASCHSIVVIDSQPFGDPLDIKVFESTGWHLEAGSIVKSGKCQRGQQKEEIQVEICHQYQFASALQRMSVIIKASDVSSYQVYCKGSPEMVSSLSKTETVPLDLHQQLHKYTEEGYRVIAIASKLLDSSVDVHHLKRTDIEKDLSFIGLIILENCLKPETTEVIKNLRKANLKTVMITGDNIQTAVSVAKECGIISSNEVVVDVQVTLPAGKPVLLFGVNNNQNIKEFGLYKNDNNLECGLNMGYRYVLSGADWALVFEHFSKKIPELVDKGAVFARMSGNQKQQLIQELQKLGYYVAMCGDGANDCGALKAAHVGISLSEEESSVASPFTSKIANISCVPKVIKEGRAALTTSIGVFKFMICYSLTQFSSVIVLYGIDSNLTSMQFFFIDICLVLHFMSLFGKTKAYKGVLNKKRPLTSLLCFSSVSSIALQMMMVIFFQILAYKLIQEYDWFVPFQFNPDKANAYTSYENYAVFGISIFQYIILAISFSKGKPYRMPIYTNKLFLASLTLMILICTYIILYPAGWITSLLEMVIPPKFDAVFVILGLALGNLICSLFIEDLFVGYILSSKIWPNVRQHFKQTSDKQSLQVPFDLVLKNNCKDSITYESNTRRTSNKAQHCYTNNAFHNSETHKI